MREPVGRLTRRHAGALDTRERMRLRAGAIVRGDDPDRAAGGAMTGEAGAVWGGAGDTLERTGILGMADAEADRLRSALAAATAMAARFAALLRETAADAAEREPGEQWAGILADFERIAADAAALADGAALELATARELAAARWAAFDAWAADVYGADPWRILEAAAVDHVTGRAAAGDPRALPEPGELAAHYRAAADRLRAIIAAAPPDPEAVERERAWLEASARWNAGGA